MKLHLNHFRHYHFAPHALPHEAERWRNVVYLALLVTGVPAVVAATMFVVHYLYDGVMWLLPS